MLDHDALDELEWRLMAALSSVEISKLLAHYSVKGARLLVVLAAGHNTQGGKQIKVVDASSVPSVVIDWPLQKDSVLEVTTACFYCARPALLRDLKTQLPTCSNCAAGPQEDYERL